MEKLGLTYRGEAFWRGFDQVWYGIERQRMARVMDPDGIPVIILSRQETPSPAE